MTEIIDLIIRGELITAILLSCICMGTWLGRGRP